MPRLDDPLEADLQDLFLHPVEVPEIDPILRRGRHRLWRRRGALVVAVAGLVVAAVTAGPLNDSAERIQTADKPAHATTPTSTEPALVGPNLEDVTVLVLNASGRSGVAGRLTCELEDLGLQMATAQNSDAGPVDASAVFGLPGFEAAAEDLADRLEVATTAPPPELIAQAEAMRSQVVLIAGADRAGSGSSGASSTSTVPNAEACST